MIYLVFKNDSEGELLVGACGTVEEADEMIHIRCKRDCEEALNAVYGKEPYEVLEKVREKFRGYSVISAG